MVTKGAIEPTKGEPKVTEEVKLEGVISDIKDRGLSKETCSKFGVTVVYGADGSIDKHYYPLYSLDRQLLSAKIRICKTKAFPQIGTENTRGAKKPLWGQHVCRGKGKLTVTEGEIDAMSVSEMWDNKWDVVSLVDGSGSAARDVRDNLDFLEGYDEVRFCFDMDEAGDKAWEAVKDILEPGKAFRVHLPLKDANAMLVSRKLKEFQSCWWNAKQYTPDGIVNAADIWDDIVERRSAKGIPYPYGGLNDMTKGIQSGTVVTLTSGSGMGKSQFTRELTYWLFRETEDNIGVLALEESKAITGLGIMSLEANQRLHLDEEISTEELKPYFDKTLGTGRFYLFDHFGSTSEDNILNRIRFMIKGCGCTKIILDHLSIVVSDQEGGDERKTIDAIMTKLRMIAEETGATIFVVVHLKRPEGKNHEEGARVTLGHLRGSGSIAQLSDLVVAFERNQQAESLEERNTTAVRVLKNRWVGETGVACHLYYDSQTGRMFEKSPAVAEEDSL